MVDKKLQGKKNKAAGGRFESKVRKDLESKGWIVCKWSNNVELYPDSKDSEEDGYVKSEVGIKGKLIPAKRKFNPFSKALSIGTGFCDFICFQSTEYIGMKEDKRALYEIIGVEAKSNGYLDKEEKAKCQWLLDNNIFSKILIAKKGEKRGEIEHVEFNSAL